MTERDRLIKENHNLNHEILSRIKEFITSEGVILNNKAVIVSGSPYRSRGVTGILSNHYKPDDKAIEEIAKAEDKGDKRSYLAYKPTVTQETFQALFQERASVKFTDFHDSVVAKEVFYKNLGLVPSGFVEFKLGCKSLVIRELPREEDPESEIEYRVPLSELISTEYGLRKFVHLTGSIDMIKYNERTGKIVFIELKTGSTQWGTMRSLYLKEKYVKQLCMYSYMMRYIARLAGINLKASDFELMIVAENSSQKTMVAWSVVYDPITFLGSRWSPHWYNIIDSRPPIMLFLSSVMSANRPSTPQSNTAAQIQSNNNYPCCVCQNPSCFQGKAFNKTLYFCSVNCKNKLRFRNMGNIANRNRPTISQ